MAVLVGGARNQHTHRRRVDCIALVVAGLCFVFVAYSIARMGWVAPSLRSSRRKGIELYLILLCYLLCLLIIYFIFYLSPSLPCLLLVPFILYPHSSQPRSLVPCLCVGVLQAAIASLCPSLPSVQYPVVSLFRFSFLAPRSSSPSPPVLQPSG